MCPDAFTFPHIYALSGYFQPCVISRMFIRLIILTPIWQCAVETSTRPHNNAMSQGPWEDTDLKGWTTHKYTICKQRRDDEVSPLWRVVLVIEAGDKTEHAQQCHNSVCAP